MCVWEGGELLSKKPALRIDMSEQREVASLHLLSNGELQDISTVPLLSDSILPV